MNKKPYNTDKPWLDSYGSHVPELMNYKNLTIPGFFMQTVKAYPDHTALNFKGYTISYVQLLNMINIFSCCLKKFGVKKGDCVGIVLPNVIPCVVSYYATLKIGGVAVMISPDSSDRELEFQLNDSGAKVIVALDMLADRMIALRKKSRIERVIYTSLGDYLPFPKNRFFSIFNRQKGFGPSVSPARDLYSWKTIMSERPLIVGEESISLRDIAMVQYTEDSNGTLKGVMLTHENLSSQVQQVDAWFPDMIKGQEKSLGVLPFFHRMGMPIALNWAMINGWETILVPKTDADTILRVIKKTKPGVTVFLSSMISSMFNHSDIRKADLSSLKACLFGDGPLHPKVVKALEEKCNAVMIDGFGLAEATAITHIKPLSGKNPKVGSIGVPVSDTECKLEDLLMPGRDVPVGSTGELLIKGPQVMQGYLNQPDESTRTLWDGWLHTGDVAYRDDDGFFYVVDRVKDMIVSDGHNVYPREIDEVVTRHPKVSEVCTIGVPHERLGEQVKLFVVLKHGETASPDEFIEFCKDKIDPYKWPTQVEIRDELPKTHIGKILRQKLKDDEYRRS